MRDRPEFLRDFPGWLNGIDMIEAFRALSKDAAADVDAWLVSAVCFGSLTWQERCLYEWINEQDWAAP